VVIVWCDGDLGYDRVHPAVEQRGRQHVARQAMNTTLIFRLPVLRFSFSSSSNSYPHS